jgi:hypothetical protein
MRIDGDHMTRRPLEHMEEIGFDIIERERLVRLVSWKGLSPSSPSRRSPAACATPSGSCLPACTY